MKIDANVNQIPVQKPIQPQQANYSEKKVAEITPKENPVSSDTGSNIDITA